MGFVRYKDDSGHSWSVNADGVWHVVREEAFARELLKRSKVVTEKGDRSLVGLFRGPDIQYVKTDFNGFRGEVDQHVAKTIPGIRNGMAASGSDVYRQLVAMRTHTLKIHEHMRKLQEDAHKVTAANVAQSTKIGEQGKAVATAIRDASAEGLMVAATFLTGQTALAGLAAGSLSKGLIRYQDTRNLPGAILESSVTLMVGMLDLDGPVGRAAVAAGKASAVGEVAMLANLAERRKTALFWVGVGINSVKEGVQAYVPGQGLKKPLIDAFVAACGEGAAHEITPHLERMAKHLALPIHLEIRHVHSMKAATTKLGVDSVTTLAKDGIAEVGKDYLGKLFDVSAPPELKHQEDLKHAAARDTHLTNERPDGFINRTAMHKS